jgi:hypothetical protein
MVLKEAESQELAELASQCVKIAKQAWEDNFKTIWSNGDNNRTAIGKIASTLLKHCLK